MCYDFLLYSQLSYRWLWFLFDPVGSDTCVSRLTVTGRNHIANVSVKLWSCQPLRLACTPLSFSTSSVITGFPWAFFLGPRDETMVWGYHWTRSKHRNTFCDGNFAQANMKRSKITWYFYSSAHWIKSTCSHL